MSRGASVPFTHPDVQAIVGRLEAAADALAEQGGTLAWGVFRRGETGIAAKGDVPYRIASMTKSFTAAATGLLAADGLDLDSPLDRIIPELAGTSIADRTCRQALTMGTGFTKDDPWADRVEAMTRTELIDYIKRGAIPIAPADTGYEYSNLGYALLGLVTESVTGKSFIEFVTAEVLHPFGLSRTGFDVADFPDLMSGIRIDRSGEGHPAELTGPGVFSPIGGVISTVNDIGTWMNAHMDALDDLDGYAPGALPRILTDNQQSHRLVEVQRSEHHTESVNYGFGLQPRLDSRFGRVICHSGGYPGYGSHMRWFPDLGLSIVVFGNTTYYPAESTVRDAIDAGWAAATGDPGLRLTRTSTSVPAPHHPVAPEQSATVLRAANLVIDFDESVADELFTINMDLDEPRAERRERFDAWRDELQLTQPFTPDDVTMTTPLKGTVTVPDSRTGGESDSANTPATNTTATITVSLDHLGEVQTISLSS
ncbi:serine hydrolase domain-containing protein [Brevibacterium sp. UCMA 11754]|uniref:serine hydrolase domain-containing protein n=1 Tax=Brevibacterium sp. UCMA 11754 TaxID=2749198 RepID=UPI001F2EC19D|nr:serine hydrolase domain-containing protein [Brevibacterium sp. UCMA 11754]MCF2572984.1 beta-lactamase family protein [Brevibacterium sp. UCMA 11754]